MKKTPEKYDLKKHGIAHVHVLVHPRCENYALMLQKLVGTTCTLLRKMHKSMTQPLQQNDM